MSVDKKDSEGGPDRDPGEVADAALLARLRSCGASLPEDADVDVWAQRVQNKTLDPAFAAKAVEAVLAGLESGKNVEAREQALAGALPWNELVPALWAAAGLTREAGAAMVGASGNDLVALLQRPTDASMELLARLVEQLEMRIDDAVQAIRRSMLNSRSRRSRGQSVLLSPRLARKTPRGSAKGPLKRVEDELKRRLSERGRHDLL